MALQCGIVGLPNVGKSTLFNCLSNAKAQAANFPFCTIEPNVGVITVPDERLIRLAEIDKPKRVIPTTIEIVDIAGLVKGASKGEGLGNKFLGNIRTTHAIIHVLRCFENSNITHVDGTIDPVRDKEVIDTELQLKDLETIENRLAKTQKQAAVGGDRTAKRTVELLLQYKALLEQGKNVFPLATDDAHKPEHVGGGWIRVGAEKLEYGCVMEALERGDFYASCGPEIHSLTLEDNILKITCSDANRIVLHTHFRVNMSQQPEPGQMLNQGEFDLSVWREVSQNDPNAFFRLMVYGADGTFAATRAYWLRELGE